MNKPLDSENMIQNDGSVKNENPASSNEELKNLPEEKVEETPIVIEEKEEAVNLEDQETVTEESVDAAIEKEPDVEIPSEEEISVVEETIEDVIEETIEEVNVLEDEPEEKSITEINPEEGGELVFEIQEEVETEVESEKVEISEKEIPSDRKQIVELLAVVVTKKITEGVKNEVEFLKQAFYKQKKYDTEEAKQAFLSAGGSEEEFIPTEDELDENLKELLSAFREKKATLTAETEKIKEENLAKKKLIIERIKDLSENTSEDFYKVYNEFRKLQQQWKEIKPVPQTVVNQLWKEYQQYSEKFYDLLKINNEMRDYDFKKNLELKQAFCETVEKLDNEKDIISAFHQVQKLHQDWREIGPVARELRDEIWNRFKQASNVIYKKYQEHFEALHALEQRNLEEKTTFCEEVEAIDYSKLNTFKDWDAQNKRVLELQEKWKTIGFAPRKQNVKIFDRFRSSCDYFFRKKSEFFRGIRETMEANLEKRKELCEKAEALKDNQEWKETTDKFIALQKDWKAIGPVSRKYSEAIWKRFITACDYFFEQKNTHFSSQKTEEVENLKKKKEIIDKINEIDESLPSNEAVALIRGFMSEWNSIGFVPFREKDKIYKEYRKAIDKHFDRLKIDEAERRLQTFKSNLNEISGGDGRSRNRLLSEREKLMRTYERLKNDIQTYENNIGFLSVSSKGGGGLVKEMNRKIESLKEELNLIVKKIEVIDENFDSVK